MDKNTKKLWESHDTGFFSYQRERKSNVYQNISLLRDSCLLISHGLSNQYCFNYVLMYVCEVLPNILKKIKLTI